MAQAEPRVTDVRLEMTASADAEARCVPVTVVAVKWPGHCIIRAMRCFSSVEDVTHLIRPYVAALPPDELEWTHHTYKFPGYLVYGSGELLGLNTAERGGYNWPVPPNGAVYIFPMIPRPPGVVYGEDVYRGPVRRLDA